MGGVKALNKVILKLVTGEDVYYGLCGKRVQAETILMKIKDESFIKVTDSKGKVFTIFLDKVVGCYIKKE